MHRNSCKIEFVGDSSSDDGRAGPSSSMKRKHAPLPWRNSFVNDDSKKKTNNAVIEISDSSSSAVSESIDESDDSDSVFESPKKKRKLNDGSSFSCSRIYDFDELETDTQEAKRAELQSIFHRKENEITLEKAQQSSSNKIVLDVVKGAKTAQIVIHNELTELLKPHQIDGIKHMYNCCYGSVKGVIKGPKEGAGCILAHCMGLGKTLQLITLLHTVINYPEFGTNRILVLCPKSTLSNWKAEINKWIGSIRKTRRLKVFEFSDSRPKDKQLDKLVTWSKYDQKSENAACFLITYESFRSLVFYGQQAKRKAQQAARNDKSPTKVNRVQEIVQRTLLNATDLIVCDEGHMIKNLGSVINRAVTQLKTPRRIVLTGTPIQNNLMEYYAMVNFVKPSFLGTPKEFRYFYANPIEKGQHSDSTSSEIREMRIKSFNLNRELESFVHRCEVSFLMKELPEKFEYVLYVPMSEKQINLYEHYLVENPYTIGSKKIFTDYNALRKIWTHPKQLEISFDKATKRKNSFLAATSVQAKHNDSEADNESDSSTVNPVTAINRDWWRPFVTEEELNSILLSPKFELMLEILKEAERRSEKCLIFSTSVVCLDIVEYFLKQTKAWRPERDYYRLDGSTKNFQRNKMIVEFNKEQNSQVKAFLISAKAGGQGINLTAANRIILLDTSWNPSVDQQSIFRTFRFGQQKNCFIYRLLAMGTMEEKIYSRSVTKQAMSFRVIDKQQIDRNYSMAELAELYTFTKPDMNERQIPIQPKDELLGHLLNKFPTKVFKYHKHESLLDNKYEEELTEEEKEEALRVHKIKKTGIADAAAAGASTDLTNSITGPSKYISPNPFDEAFEQLQKNSSVGTQSNGYHNTNQLSMMVNQPIHGTNSTALSSSQWLSAHNSTQPKPSSNPSSSSSFMSKRKGNELYGHGAKQPKHLVNHFNDYYQLEE